VFVRLCLVVLGAGLVGDGSRDKCGEPVTEVLVEVHFDCWVSILALDVAELSLSAELRLDILASSPGAVALVAIVTRTQT